MKLISVTRSWFEERDIADERSRSIIFKRSQTLPHHREEEERMMVVRDQDGYQASGRCWRPLQLKSGYFWETLLEATKPGKPEYDVFLTLTKWLLYLNLTKSLSTLLSIENWIIKNIKFQNILGFQKHIANSYSGDWVVDRRAAGFIHFIFWQMVNITFFPEEISDLNHIMDCKRPIYWSAGGCRWCQYGRIISKACRHSKAMHLSCRVKPFCVEMFHLIAEELKRQSSRFQSREPCLLSVKLFSRQTQHEENTAGCGGGSRASALSASLIPLIEARLDHRGLH